MPSDFSKKVDCVQFDSFLKCVDGNLELVSELFKSNAQRLTPAAAATAALRVIMQDVIEGKDYSFPKQEEHVLKFWEDTDAFKQQLKRSEGKKPYVFYAGPPFATGLPHYGHLLAGTLKVINTSQFANVGKFSAIVVGLAPAVALDAHARHGNARQAILRL